MRKTRNLADDNLFGGLRVKVPGLQCSRVILHLIRIQKLFDTQTTFSPILSDIETLRKFKQTRHLADGNLFGRLRVKDVLQE